MMYSETVSEWNSETREIFESGNLPFEQLFALQASEAGGEAGVVVGAAAAPVAIGAPAADFTMLDGFGVNVWTLLDGCFETSLDSAKINGGVIEITVAFAFEVQGGRDNVDGGRFPSLLGRR